MEKDDESIVINNRRKKNDLSNSSKKSTNSSSKIINTTLGNNNDTKSKQVFHDMINESEFDNCQVNLKPNNINKNRPNSRKRSAFKYIEDNLEKGSETVSQNNNKEVKELSNNKIDIKPKIVSERSENNINKFLNNINNLDSNSEKKIEYESRRKKPMSFINGIDSFTANKDNTSASGYESRRQINYHKNQTYNKDSELENSSGVNKNLPKI